MSRHERAGGEHDHQEHEQQHAQVEMRGRALEENRRDQRQQRRDQKGEKSVLHRREHEDRGNHHPADQHDHQKLVRQRFRRIKRRAEDSPEQSGHPRARDEVGAPAPHFRDGRVAREKHCGTSA